MKKERANMYEMMIKDSKVFKLQNKSFFIDSPSCEKENVEMFISKKMANSLTHDMEELARYMTSTILEGLLNGRR